MSETSGQCSRCRGPMPEVTTRLLIDSGPLQSSYPAMDLCRHCTESLERWIQRRHRRSRHGSGTSHGHRSREPEPAALDPADDEPYGSTSGFAPIHVILLVVIFLLCVAGTVGFLAFGH